MTETLRDRAVEAMARRVATVVTHREDDPEFWDDPYWQDHYAGTYRAEAATALDGLVAFLFEYADPREYRTLPDIILALAR